MKQINETRRARRLRENKTTVRDIAGTMNWSKTTVQKHTRNTPKPMAHNPWGFPSEFQVYDCQLISKRIPILDKCLEMLDKDKSFEGELFTYGNNITSGFPDYIIFKDGKPFYAIEQKTRNSIITYKQWIWLTWFQKCGVISMITYRDDKYSLSLICNMHIRFRFYEDMEPNNSQTRMGKYPQKIDRSNIGIIKSGSEICAIGRPRLSQSRIAEVLKLRKEGASYREIERAVGVSYVTAWRYCRVLD